MSSRTKKDPVPKGIDFGTSAGAFPAVQGSMGQSSNMIASNASTNVSGQARMPGIPQ